MSLLLMFESEIYYLIFDGKSSLWVSVEEVVAFSSLYI